jgi:RNA exonuclease 4
MNCGNVSEMMSFTPTGNNDTASTMHVRMCKPMNTMMISHKRRSQRCFALDCEMVGVGPKSTSDLARVSIVDSDGNCVFDTFVKVDERVTGYRTEFSGIRLEDLLSKDALPFGEVRLKVRKILNGCILVGHGLENDLKILNLNKCAYSLRDTSKYIPFMKEWWDGTNRPRRLRDLIWENFGLVIQSREHSSIEDAAAAMSLYNLV